MTRFLGMTILAVSLVIAASRAEAQTYSTGYDAGAYHAYGVSSYGTEPYGGFGFEYTQAPIAGGVVMDPSGMLYQAPLPYLDVPPTAGAAQPHATVTRSRPGSKSRLRAVPPQPRYALATGSLYWPGASGVILYSPALRYASYGSYGRGGYGTLNYGGAYNGWHGWSLGY